MRATAPWTIDVAGGLLTLAVTAAGVYYGFVKTAAAAERAARLTGATRTLRGELVGLQSELERAQAAVAESRARLAERGQLPRQTPVERDLQTLAQYARANHFEISEVRPLGSVNYPGVIELRYAVRGAGNWAALAGFLAAFEAIPFWADVTHLKIDRSVGQAPNDPPLRMAELTVSFFASVETPAETRTAGSTSLPPPRPGAGPAS